jgi:hypothetical protein
MSLRGFLAELRHRGVLKVATVYLGTGVVVLEVGTHLLHNFEAPHWVLKVFSSVVILGFPIACLAAWGLEFTSQGIHAAPAIASSSSAQPRRTDALFAVVLALIFAVVTAMGLKQWRHPVPEIAAPGAVVGQQQAAAVTPTPDGQPQTATRVPVPIVVIMVTSAPRGVYEKDTRDKGGTNADDLNELLRDLAVNIRKESIGATWEREDQIVSQEPDLVLVHRSGFFHAMNLEFGFGYPGDADGFNEASARRLYELSDNKLVAVLGFIGKGDPRTKFLVYSRGTGGDWSDQQIRAAWVRKVEGRFPFLKGRVTTVNVPGGPAAGSFDDPETAQLFRHQVQVLLNLPLAGAAAAGPARETSSGGTR